MTELVTGAVQAVRAWTRMADGADEQAVMAAVEASLATAASWCGMALPASWEAVPVGIAQGCVLLAAALLEARDGDRGVPAAVAALWRPLRRVRLERDR